MAGVGEEEVEYESDPEEAKMSLKMRRREASDDEDEGEGRGVEGREKPVRRVDAEGESDEEGAPADYDEEEEEYLEEEEVEYEEEEEEGGERRGEREVEAVVVVEGEGGKEGGGEKLGVELKEVDGEVSNGVNENGDDNIDNQQQREEEKKENEPYAVPTAGAFYMHDDRFRDSAGGRNRRTLGGRRLWESKDDRKWGHDKFEELTVQERQYDEGRRSSRGRYRGRGRGRGALHGYSRGNRPKAYGNYSNQNNNDNQNDAPKIVRGRGPRRYQSSFKNNNDAPPAQNKQSGKSFEKPSHTSSGRATALTSYAESDTVPAKQVFASSLNYASPPFYPSSSSNKETSLTQKRDPQSGTVNRNVQPPVADENFPMAQSNAKLRGKNIMGSIGMDKLYIDDSTSGVAGKPSTTLQFPTYGSSSMNSSKSQHLRAQGRGLNSLPLTTYQPTATNNLVNRVSPSSQLHKGQRNSVQSRAQPSVQASGMQYAQRPGNVSQAFSPPKAAVPTNSLESGELESPSESSKSKTALVGKGKVTVGSGRGSFLYGGAQVMGSSGNMGTGHGDQNIPAAPTFLPVMQFGGQHPGGIGVPAVGMAFPGYVGQPQLGLGNSEMTWLPVLAGAAGALGATYCSPYLTVDGAYHARPSGQTSALTAASSKENNSKPGTEWKPSQRPELANDEFGQRQKNPRRYTEMKFDQ